MSAKEKFKMLCKKCGETFDDELKACPKCGFKKPVGKRKKFKVELPDDIKPSMPSDDFISSTSKPAPAIKKVVVDTEQTKRNKTRNTRYIDKDEEQVVQKTPVAKPTLTFESKKKEPVKPATQKPTRPAKKPMFKVEIPDEYADLALTRKKEADKAQQEQTMPLESKADIIEDKVTIEKADENAMGDNLIEEVKPAKEATNKKETKHSKQEPIKDDFEIFVGEDLYLDGDPVEQVAQEQIHEVPLDLIDETIAKPKSLSETMQCFEDERTAKNEPTSIEEEQQAQQQAQQELQQEPQADEMTQLQQQKEQQNVLRATQYKEKKLSKAEKRAAEKSLLSIKIIAVVMFVLLGSLTIVSATTQVFDASNEALMTLSFASVSDENTQEVQEFLTQVSSLLSLESYESDDFSANEILDMIKPYSDSGLYSAFFTSATLVYDNNDPDGRYTEDGERYYKIAKSDIDQIITSLGIDTVSMVIEQDYYLYEDYYYFKYIEDTETSAATYSVQIDKIKKTIEGAYYVEFSLLNQNETAIYDRYAVIGVSEQDEVITYSLDILSDEVLFNTFGEMKDLEEVEEVYSIQREVIELETSGGIILYEYIIDYPVFTGDSQLELMVNQLYSDLITAYNMDTDSIDAEYEVYASGGISDDTFPMCVYIDVSVEMYSDEYLTILQQVIEEQTIQDTEETVTQIYTNSLSSYNYLIEDASAIKLSDIVGDDKTTLYEILYRLYYGYDIEEVLTGEYLETSYYSYWQQPDEDEVPEDENNIGEDIYDGCHILTDEGVIFFYETVYGYYDEILLDNDTISSILAMETE